MSFKRWKLLPPLCCRTLEHLTPHLQSQHRPFERNFWFCFPHSCIDQKCSIWTEATQRPMLNSPLIVSLFSCSCCRNGRISSKRLNSFKSCGTPTRWSIEAATCVNTQHGWVFGCVGGRLNALLVSGRECTDLLTSFPFTTIAALHAPLVAC